MPIFNCCFCLKQFTNASGLGNHQWRCWNNNDELLGNTIIEQAAQQNESNVVNCNVLEDNDNLFMMAEDYEYAIDDEEYNFDALNIAIADKYDTIELLDEDCDESSIELNEEM